MRGGSPARCSLLQTNSRGAFEFGERKRRAIEMSRLDADGRDVATSVSIGVASFPEDGGSVDVLLEKADKALYRAKAGSRNRAARASGQT
jgi:diguanylate cyclase (GGDEF)-like protein